MACRSLGSLSGKPDAQPPYLITPWGDQVWRFGHPAASVAVPAILDHFPSLWGDQVWYLGHPGGSRAFPPILYHYGALAIRALPWPFPPVRSTFPLSGLIQTARMLPECHMSLRPAAGPREERGPCSKCAPIPCRVPVPFGLPALPQGRSPCRLRAATRASDMRSARRALPSLFMCTPS